MATAFARKAAAASTGSAAISRKSVVALPASTVPTRVASQAASSASGARSAIVSHAAAPVKEQWNISLHTSDKTSRVGLPKLISKEQVQALEAELDRGASIAALRRFNDNLRALPADRWAEVLRPVLAELTYNLESFNPAFTSCLLMVQRTIGVSDYVRRDVALKNLIQPLAGEYGMHNNQPQLKTHRELFAEFYQSLFHEPLENLVAEGSRPDAAALLWAQMSRDILGGGTVYTDPVQQASYAMGYNLAIEYLADYEKTWMLDSFRELDARFLQQQGRKVDWVFLEVHAEGEAEHAAIGHNAVLNFVPEEHTDILRKAMQDHDRDFAVFYNRVADMLAL